MVPEENGASGAKNTIIPEKTIFMDFHVTCLLIGTFIMIESFDLCPDIKKGYLKNTVIIENKQTTLKNPIGNGNIGRAALPEKVGYLCNVTR